MNSRNICRKLIVSALLGALVCCAAFAESFTRGQIKEILSDFRSYDYGKDPTPTHTINKIVQFIYGKPPLRSFTEKQMIALLESDATFRAKQFVCQQLWIIGSDESAPVLEKMLLDATTAEMACYALRTNPSDAVARALREALDRVGDQTQVRIINLLGDRKDARSVERLIALIEAEHTHVALTAADALGKIGGDEAAETIRKARTAASGDMHAVLTRAYLRCAEYYVRNKQSGEAMAIYTELLDNSESLLTRRAALVGALHSNDRLAADLMIAAIEQDEPVLRATAIANSTALKGAEVTRKLVTKLRTAAPSTQVQLVEALAYRDGPGVKDAIKAVVGSKDVRVRMAAFNGLAEMGDASCATLLCNALKKAQTQTEVDTILASLRRMQGDEISRAILNAIEDADPSTKTQLIHVISDRGYGQAVQELLKLCRNDETSVAKAALQAVGTLASHRALPQLLDVLLDSQDRTVQTEAIRAATAVIRRSSHHSGDIARLIQRRLDNTAGIPARCSLLRLLPAVPNDMSLQRLKAAAKDSHPSIRDAAVRTLAKYPDPAATDSLLQIFQTAADKAHRIVALDGCVRLLKADGTDPEGAVRFYERLVRHASTPAEKKLILSGLAEVRHPTALGIVQDFMKDNAVKPEASLAVIAIARNTAAMDPGRAAAALTLSLADSSQSNLHPQARQLLETIKAWDDFIVAWQVSGPYTQEGADYIQLHDIEFEPEKPNEKPIIWRLISAGTNPSKPWLIDLLKDMPGDSRAAYLRTWAHSDTEQNVQLLAGSDDGIKVWINRKLVHSNCVGRAAIPDTDRVPVELKPGWNSILLKITQNAPPWEFCLRLRNTDGSKAKDLQYDCLHEPLAEPSVHGDSPAKLFDGETFDDPFRQSVPVSAAR